MRITNAGDGLSDALAVLPIAHHREDRVFYVIEVEIDAVNHKPDRHGDLVRVHTGVTQRIAQCDPEVAKQVIADQADILRKARAEQEGQPELPGPDDEGSPGD